MEEPTYAKTAEDSDTVWASEGSVADKQAEPWHLEDVRKDQSRAELYAAAREAGIEGRSKMSREELAAALREAGH